MPESEDRTRRTCRSYAAPTAATEHIGKPALCYVRCFLTFLVHAMNQEPIAFRLAAEFPSELQRTIRLVH
jgi:hypothetical protein